jgi:hypothetical protein
MANKQQLGTEIVASYELLSMDTEAKGLCYRKGF